MGGILSIDWFFLAENFFPCFINRGKMACPVVHNDNQSLYLHEVTTVCLQVLKRKISVICSYACQADFLPFPLKAETE